MCGIVLAAGQGRRYRKIAGADQDKLLARCVGRDGVERPVLEHVLLNLHGVVDSLVLVTRTDRHAVIDLGRRYGCELVQLDSPGMGDSLAAGVAASMVHQPGGGGWAGWLIALGDMPFILPESIQQLLRAVQDEHICVPVQDGQFGHPVLFANAYGPALRALSGARGAKGLFRPERLCEIQVSDPGVLWDVDTPARLRFRP